MSTIKDTTHSVKRNENVGNLSLDVDQNYADHLHFINTYFPHENQEVITSRFNWALNNLSVSLINEITSVPKTYNKDNIAMGVYDILKQQKKAMQSKLKKGASSMSKGDKDYYQKLINEIDMYLTRNVNTWYDKDQDVPIGMLMTWGKDAVDNKIDDELFVPEIIQSISDDSETSKKKRKTDVDVIDKDVLTDVDNSQDLVDDTQMTEDSTDGLLMGVIRDIRTLPINDINEFQRKIKLADSDILIREILDNAVKHGIIGDTEYKHLQVALARGKEFVLPSVEFMINIRTVDYGNKDAYIVILDSHLSSLLVFDLAKGDSKNAQMDQSLKELGSVVREIRTLILQTAITTDKLDTAQRNLPSIKPHPVETSTDFSIMVSTPSMRSNDKTPQTFKKQDTPIIQETRKGEPQVSAIPKLQSVNKPKFIKGENGIFSYNHQGKVYKYSDTSTNRLFKEIIKDEEFSNLISRNPQQLEDIFFQRLLNTTR